MDIPTVEAFAHVFSRCRCGHMTHIGKGLSGLRSVVCEECDSIAASSATTLCVISIDTADTYALTAGMHVSHEGKTMAIVEIDQIMLMDGRLATPFVRVLLRAA